MPGERTALWALSGHLESALMEPFEGNYRELVDHARCWLGRGLPGDGRLDDVGLVRAVDQALPGKLFQRAVGGTQEQLRSLVLRAHSVGDKKIAVRADPQDAGKSVLESAQQIVCLFQAAFSGLS